MNVIHAGNITSLTEAKSIHRELPKGSYDIQVNPNTGQFELHHRPPFQLPAKIYGGYDEFADRCLRTFEKLNRGMAVLLSGPKGCGKTMTAKQIAISSSMPVLCVSSPFSGNGFIAFLTDLPTASVIFIDEFEKVYARTEDRNAMLGILNGAADNKHLFVLTSNSSDIGEFFNNRPGRIRYHKQYDQLPIAVLEEMIDDRMPKGKNRAALKQMVRDNGGVNPDALSALIEECLIHDEPPEKFMSFFNVSNELSGAYDVIITCSGYRPKANITPKRMALAREYVSELADHGEGHADRYYGEGKKYCEAFKQVWTATRVYPFERQDQRRGISASIHFAQTEGIRRSRSFEIQPDDIASTSIADGVMKIVTKDDKVFEFRRCHGRAVGYA